MSGAALQERLIWLLALPPGIIHSFFAFSSKLKRYRVSVLLPFSFFLFKQFNLIGWDEMRDDCCLRKLNYRHLIQLNSEAKRRERVIEAAAINGGSQLNKNELIECNEINEWSYSVSPHSWIEDRNQTSFSLISGFNPLLHSAPFLFRFACWSCRFHSNLALFEWVGIEDIQFKHQSN